MAGITHSTKAQGATEYIVLVSVVLMISLVCVAILVWPTGTTKDAKKQQTDIHFKINEIGVQVEDDSFQPITQGLVAYYKFDEGSGSSIVNSRGSNSGTASGTSWISGKSGTALVFVNDGVASIPDVSASFPSNTGTILMWMNHYSTQLQSEALVAFSDNKPILYIQAGNHNMDVLWSGGFGYSGPCILSSNSWYHIAFTWDASAGTYKIYKNSALCVSGSGASFSALTSGSEVLGNYNDGLNGTIDEVMIYNRALSQDEILLLYENPGYPQ